MVRNPSNKRMGRPKMPEELVRRNRVVTFLTDSDFHVLKSLAKTRESTLSDTCHQIILGYLRVAKPRE